MVWGSPTLPGLIWELERKMNVDFRKLLADVLKEEWEFGSRAEWRTPVKEVDVFIKQMKMDLGKIHRLEDEGQLNRTHLDLLKAVDYRLGLLDKVELQFRKADPKLSEEIRELIVEMTTDIKRLMKAVAKA